MTFGISIVLVAALLPLPGVTVPAGRFGGRSTFSLIFIGRLWSEAQPLGFAFAYEQATRHRIVPTLVETPYAAA